MATMTLFHTVESAVEELKRDPEVRETGGAVVVKLSKGQYNYFPTEQADAGLQAILGEEAISTEAQIVKRFMYTDGQWTELKLPDMLDTG